MSATPVLSRRERIMREMVRRAKEIQQGLPADDPYQVTFDVVTRGGPIEGIHAQQKYGLSIIGSEEQNAPKINQFDNTVRVVMEFNAWVDEGEEPDEVCNRVFADLQRKFREDLKLTEPDDEGGTKTLDQRQLSFNVVQTGNQSFIDGFADRQVSGAVFFNVQYKTAQDDPRLYVGDRR